MPAGEGAQRHPGAPLSRDLDALQARNRLHAALFGDAPPPLRVGRYTLLERIGRGAMGVVWAAWDPSLDRRVALKVLDAEAGLDSRARERLLHEARALARLQHPHVVTVHDAGDDNGETWIAMELVQGQDLRQWLTGRPPAAEVRAALAQAADGLVAAHAAGLVHRDVKPENLLMGDDGRLRVADFGLARPRIAPEAAPDGAAATDPIRRLTQTGARAGTPAYMAPEILLDGQPADARSDQWSLAATAWEALAGQPAFPADTLERLVVVVATREPQGSPDASPALRAALRRALSRRPEDRFPTCQPLADALRGPRRSWAPALGATAAGLLVLGALALRSGPDCAAGADGLGPAWTDEARASVSGALRTASPAEPALVDGVLAGLDRYRATWQAQALDACEDVYLRAEHSEAMLDRRRSCLEERRVAAERLIGHLREVDAVAAARATGAVAALPPLAACADLPALHDDLVPPADPQVRAQVDQARALLGESLGLQQLGRYADGEQAATDALELARGSGWPPVEAEAEVRLAELATFTGADGEPRIRQALRLAEQTGHDVLLVKAWSALAYHIAELGEGGGPLPDLAAAEALAITERLSGRARDEARVEALLASGIAAMRSSRLGEAADFFQQEHDLAAVVYGPAHPKAIPPLENLGIVAAMQGDAALSARRFEAARDAAIAALGPVHPMVAHIGMNLANSVADAGDLPGSLQLFIDAEQGFRAGLGPGHPLVGLALVGRGISLRQLGRCPEALPLATEAARIYREAAGDDFLHLPGALSLQSRCLHEAGRDEESAEAIMEAWRIAAPEGEPIPPDAIDLVFAVSSALLRQGQAARASELVDRALAIAAERPDDVDPSIAVDLGAIWARLHGDASPEEARRRMQLAIEAWRPAPGNRVDVAEGEAWLRGH